MSDSLTKRGLGLGQAARYRIVVQGALAESTADRLGGLHVQVAQAAHGGAAAVLEGQLRDQAQLIGLLNALYEMRLPLLEVHVVEIG